MKRKLKIQKNKLGWKAFVTNTCKMQMSLSEAVLCYRKEYRVERIFNRLKSELNISPLYVKNDDQITGLTHLLTLGIRALTSLEFVVRRSLQNDNEALENLHPENKTTSKPTVERILKAFSKIHLTIIKTANNQIILKYLTALSEVQKKILSKLGLNENAYQQITT